MPRESAASDAACVAAGYASPPRTCTLCDASERGACVAHRRHGTDCARCGTLELGGEIGIAGVMVEGER